MDNGFEIMIFEALRQTHAMSMVDIRAQVPGVTWKHVNQMRESGILCHRRGTNILELTKAGKEKAFQAQFPVSQMVMCALEVMDVDAMTGEQALIQLRALKDMVTK